MAPLPNSAQAGSLQMVAAGRFDPMGPYPKWLHFRHLRLWNYLTLWVMPTRSDSHMHAYHTNGAMLTHAMCLCYCECSHWPFDANQERHVHVGSVPACKPCC